jgi:hypothetical protein
MKKKGLVCSIVLVLLLVLTTVGAQAQCYFNPLFLPFAVAGAAVRTAAAITTVVVPAPSYGYPAYYGPYYAPGPGYYGPRPFYPASPWIGGPRPHHGRWARGYWR